MARPKQDWSAKWGPIADQICLRISQGETLRQICKTEGFPSHSTVCDWILGEKAFADRYARARQDGLDMMAQEMVEIADDGKNDSYVDEKGNKRTDWDVVNRSRLRIDTRKWLLSKLRPDKYGDRTALEHSGPGGKPLTVLVRSVLDEPFPEEKKTGG